MEEFINLHQGCISVQEYCLKVTKLSMYAPTLVSNPMYEISRFVIGVYDYLVEECCSEMLHDNMDIFI